MKYLSLVLLCSISSVWAQPSGPFNFDFERQSGELPEGWFQWGTHPLGVDTSLVQSGKYSAFVESVEGSTQGFGCIAYTLPANYTGENITLEGYMKLEDVKEGFAGLLLRIDGDGRSLAFDNMQQQAIKGTADWKKYSLTLPFPEGGSRMFVAGILSGTGKAWFDNFTVTIDGQNLQTLPQVDRPLSKAELDSAFDEGSKIVMDRPSDELVQDLDLLGRVWGFLKYHDPRVSTGAYNWDYELFRMLPDYLGALGDGRQEVLIDWLDSYGEVPACEPCGMTWDTAYIKPDHRWMEGSRVSEELKGRLRTIYENRLLAGRHYVKSASRGVNNPHFTHEDAYSEMGYPDDGFRLLAAYRFWNMIQYYFPYKHLTDRDWNDVLPDYVERFLLAENELAYEIAATQLIGEISDTHANVYRGQDQLDTLRGVYYPPLRAGFVEDQFVVLEHFDPDNSEDYPLQVGDVITHIEGKTVSAWVDSVRIYYPASNEPTRLRNIARDLLRSQEASLSIQVENSGSTSIDLPLRTRYDLGLDAWRSRKREAPSYQWLGDIGYVSLGSINQDDIFELKAQFREAKGIIIDIRNYPKTFVPFRLGSYFLSEPTPFAQFTRANFENPGEFHMTQPISIQPEASAFGPFTAPLVVLVNEQSQSQSEYTAMAFRATPNCTIIGSTTAGADGNVSEIFLPGGIRTMISGIGVYYPDGTETQRAGIVPDIYVEPTIEGVRAGRDEVLERAISLIEDLTLKHR